MTDLTSKVSIADLVIRELGDAEVYDMWYDWFCRNTSLVRKGRALLSRVRSIAKSPRFDAKTHYAFFKNNCPGNGNLYDDFRICDIVSGDVVYCVTPKCGHKGSMFGEAQVWGKHPVTGEFEELITGKWSDVKAFFTERDDAKVLEMINATQRLNLIRQAEIENRNFDNAKRWAEWEAKLAPSADEEYASQLEALLDR